MIPSGEEFIRLRKSTIPEEQRRAANEEALEVVWRELVADHPEMREWVAHNKTVPISILELLHTDSLAKVRFVVAGKRKLPERLQWALAADRDASVRHAVARNAKVVPAVLRKLAGDAEAFVREAAQERIRRLGSKPPVSDKET